MAKDVRTGRPDTPLESGGTWAVARLAHFSQCFPSGQHIRIGYAIIRERGPYTLHTQTVPLAQHSSVHPGRNSVRRHFTSGYLTAGQERRTFQLLRSDISRSCDSVHPESIHDRHFRLPGFCIVPRCSPEASRYLLPTKLDFFSQDILCKFLFSPCNQSKILLGYFLENNFSIYIFEPL